MRLCRAIALGLLLCCGLSAVAEAKCYPDATGSGQTCETRQQLDSLAGGTLNSAISNAAYAANLNNGQAAVGFTVTGLTAAGATLTLEGSNDGGTTWSAISEIVSGGSLISTLTADTQFGINAGGRTNVRLRVSSTGTGTITVASNASSASSRVTVQAGNIGVTSLPATPASSGDGTITAGGTAQNLFSGATPPTGWAVYNPDPSEDCWASDSATAAANAQGSIRIAANGGGYETPIRYKPSHAVSIVCATTGHKLTARQW